MLLEIGYKCVVFLLKFSLFHCALTEQLFMTMTMTAITIQKAVIVIVIGHSRKLYNVSLFIHKDAPADGRHIALTKEKVNHGILERNTQFTVLIFFL